VVRNNGYFLAIYLPPSAIDCSANWGQLNENAGSLAAHFHTKERSAKESPGMVLITTTVMNERIVRALGIGTNFC
jgi:hypothetical protein